MYWECTYACLHAAKGYHTFRLLSCHTLRTYVCMFLCREELIILENVGLHVAKAARMWRYACLPVCVCVCVCTVVWVWLKTAEPIFCLNKAFGKNSCKVQTSVHVKHKQTRIHTYTHIHTYIHSLPHSHLDTITPRAQTYIAWLSNMQIRACTHTHTHIHTHSLTHTWTPSHHLLKPTSHDQPTCKTQTHTHTYTNFE
jgi:hypothetical protein